MADETDGMSGQIGVLVYLEKWSWNDRGGKTQWEVRLP